MGGRRIELVANVASGAVGAGAPDEASRILAEMGVDAKVRAAGPGEIMDVLRAAVDAGPDLLMVLAGDGTVRAAAELCGPDGPVIAPLPGGTMNMLPHAVYGTGPWQDALRRALTLGREQPLAGGEVDGRLFLVAAIIGSPALWAPAREAARFGKPGLAFLLARRAVKRAFTGRLRYTLDGGPREKAEVLTFMCPLTSRALDADDQALEAAAMDPRGVSDVVRLGFHALFGDWRADPAVETQRCQIGRVYSSQRIPALLDGEAVRLNPLAEIRFRPNVARVLAVPHEAEAKAEPKA